MSLRRVCKDCGETRSESEFNVEQWKCDPCAGAPRGSPLGAYGARKAASTDSNATALGMLIGLALSNRQPVAEPRVTIVQPPASSAGVAASNEGQQMKRMVSSRTLDRYRQVMKGPSMEEVANVMVPDEEPSSPQKRLVVDDVVMSAKQELENRKNRTPKEVLLDLQRGNGRFWMGLSQRPELNAMERRALILAQAPCVTIVGCADSRVPVEIVFDQGLGDIFVVRVAGNVLDQAAHGSVEYSVKHLNVKVIIVLGHEGCGAVRGAMAMGPAEMAKEPENLQFVLKAIKSSLPLERINSISDHRARDREAVVVNCTKQMSLLQNNPVIGERVAKGTLMVVGAFYEITSGIVDFFSLDRNGLLHDI